MTMDSTRVNVPLRVGGGKKMRKRKELDALAGGGKRCGSGGGKRGSGDQLLSESTDEEMWTGGGMRGAGVRASGRYLIRRRTCTSMLRACTALLVLACVLATTTVMWLFIDVREQATFLRTQLDQVVAGNQGVPDTLQKCHSISRELQKNQTELFNRITALSQQIAAFNTQVSVVSSGLNKVEKQLKASPELVNVASLSSSVASFGSQIQDLVSTTKQLKETNTRLDETSHALELNITSLKQKVSEMKSTSISPTEVPDSNALASLSSLVNSLRSNLTNINNTLSSKLQWSSEDELRDSKLIQSLRDMTANLSARVTTLESKSNSKDLKTLQVNFDQFSLKIDGRFNDVNNKIGELQGKCSKLENNTAHLENTVNNMRLSYSTDSSAATTVVDAVDQPSEKLKPSNVTEP